jgi:signal peptidase I
VFWDAYKSQFKVKGRDLMSTAKSSVKSSILEWGVAVISALLIAVVIRFFLFAPYEVNGTSMYPTLNGNEMLIVNKFVYDVSNPNYGEIIVFHTNEHRDFIKRVIGLPGDKVSVENGNVYRNGKKLTEPYIAEEMIGDFSQVVVPKGKLFVLGDNRNNSKDSRIIGTVDQKAIVGRADIVVMPFKELRVLGK